MIDNEGLNHFNATLYKVVQSFALQHVVLQQGKIYQLTHYLIATCVFAQDGILLALFVSNLLFYCAEFVFFCLSDLVILLAFLLLLDLALFEVEGCNAGFDRQEFFATCRVCICQYLLYKSVV